MKIQISKTKTVEWRAPWEKKASVDDVVGVELESGDKRGCPAVRIQRRKDSIAIVAAGFVPPPDGTLPKNWDELKRQPKWSLPSAFRAANAALTVNSPEAYLRQSAAADTDAVRKGEGIPTPKDGVRSIYRRMMDESFVLQTGLPEYQTLWLARLLPEGHRPAIVSVQTTQSALLASMAAQPGFCENGDEVCTFVTQSTIRVASFRKGMPLLYRECQGVGGAAAMRAAVKTRLGLNDEMLETVFANEGIIDTRPVLDPLLKPLVSQLELSIDYLKSRLGADVFRVFVMGDAAGCAAVMRSVGETLSVPLLTPGAFDGLEMPARETAWMREFCTPNGASQPFLAALGAALAAMEDAK